MTNILPTQAHRTFWALVGPTFEGSYFEDQLRRTIERPAPAFQIGELVTAERNPYRKHRRDRRPDAGQITGMQWCATAGYWVYDVGFASDSWSEGVTGIQERHINSDWHQGTIDRRRSHHKSREADRFNSELAAFLAAGPEHEIGERLVWDVPAYKQGSRNHPLPAQVEVMVVGIAARSRLQWDDGPEGRQTVMRFELSWEYDILPVIGICHYHAEADELRSAA
jgi:hypothetical protein